MKLYGNEIFFGKNVRYALREKPRFQSLFITRMKIEIKRFDTNQELLGGAKSFVREL